MSKNKKIIFIDTSLSPGSFYMGGMGSGKSMVMSQIPGYSEDLIESEQFKNFIDTGIILSKKEVISHLKKQGFSTNIIVGPEDYDLYKDGQ